MTTAIRVALLRDGELRQGGPELIDQWRRGTDDRLWVDIEEPTEEVLEPLLEGRFGFHELAAEDSLSPTTLPKYDPFGAYDFFIFRTADVDLSEHATQTFKVAAFLSSEHLFTVHGVGMQASVGVWQRLASDHRLLANGPDFLLYSVVDQMVDAYFRCWRRSRTAPTSCRTTSSSTRAPASSMSCCTSSATSTSSAGTPSPSATCSTRSPAATPPTSSDSTSSTSATSTTTCSGSARPSTCSATP